MLTLSESPPGALAPPPPALGATVTVAAEIAALATYVVSVGEIDGMTLRALLLDLGLVAKVPFDPEAHGRGADEDLIPGDSFLAYSTAMRDAIDLGRPHLRGWNGRLN
ncbi:hypothetical protein PMNALOAF_2710 [Methylobacterium adhaesivum]|uniref:Uncharacterized protein n=1 Tax=Methylobacterium adhaesivum TaxID=333297 RepID=A0ABT8BJY4_9HYPH|nr:hypothetical protein [Methylobacterium adhaesivum]MDN3592064.1 hypothetical protein [Methylobacterium adhaesivum]GJD31451.1 hypothetical protein PMNALOAF_2710 [Methylobacterium adhaesivum]